MARNFGNAWRRASRRSLGRGNRPRQRSGNAMRHVALTESRPRAGFRLGAKLSQRSVEWAPLDAEAALDITRIEPGKRDRDRRRRQRPDEILAPATAPPAATTERLKHYSALRLYHIQTQPQTRRPRRHQQRQTRRRRKPRRHCVFWVQSSRAPGTRSSSGIALDVSEGPARPVAATAAPNKIPRVKARRSICFIELFLRRLARPTHSSFRPLNLG